ncbi:MAG: M1 family metallopeptidase [Flavobacteriales bacterium]
MRLLYTIILCFLVSIPAIGQPLSRTHAFTHADTLRGSNGPYRAWWDVTHYDVTVRPDFTTKSIVGTTIISFRATAGGQRMQVDLQQPLTLQSISLHAPDGESDLHFSREGNVAWVDLPEEMAAGSSAALTIQYSGIPREARNPPWDGGWIWKKDPQGDPWMSAACQGLGASVWYPCKDIQSDEPDSAALHIITPDSLQAVGNGRLRSKVENKDGTTTWSWAVVNPINNYDLIPAIGKYAHIHVDYAGIEGPLDLDYWVLQQNEAKAREHFQQVPLMMKCYEEHLGPYPFYADGYKLVEAPELGMEHQSAIAYGNHFMNGYRGNDLSGTGWGLKWDYVIIHESAHEWFGNSITTADIADMWVHEGFTDYAETIYTQCQYGDAAGDDYVIGLRKNIRNDMPIIGPYGVNQEGSNDMYYKGANMIHTLRHVMADDSLFFAMLREMNRKFRHAIVTSPEVEVFISSFSGRDFSTVFDQYLRTTKVPRLEWTIKKDELFVHWSNCVAGFNMPAVIVVNGEEKMVPITDQWSSPAHGMNPKTATLLPDRNWYVTSERVDKKALKGLLRK